jgi:hypothetical protein
LEYQPDHARTGRAVHLLEDEMVKELKAAALLYVDKKPWIEWGGLFWLRGIISPSVFYFLSDVTNVGGSKLLQQCYRITFSKGLR